jgi:hypothetical protein
MLAVLLMNDAVPSLTDEFARKKITKTRRMSFIG